MVHEMRIREMSKDRAADETDDVVFGDREARISKHNASNAAPVIKGCLPAIYPYGSIDRDMGGSLVGADLGPSTCRR